MDLFNLFKQTLGKIIFYKKASSSVTACVSPYTYPTYRCSSKIILCGPFYGDLTYFGSFFIDSKNLREWALNHSRVVWSSDQEEQNARVLLPIWLSDVGADKDLYIASLDAPMRRVLVPYMYDFLMKGWVSFFCHECKVQHHDLIDNSHSHRQLGRHSSWTDEWRCPNGHIVHRKQEQVHWITRGSTSPSQS